MDTLSKLEVKMLSSLREILKIQELDIKMIRLMRLKKNREKELGHVEAIKSDLEFQSKSKEEEIVELKKNIRLGEGDLEDVKERIKGLEERQSSVKKLEEFNALTQETSTAERERLAKEQKLSDMYDRLSEEEDLRKSLQDSYKSTVEESKNFEKEIVDGIVAINEEGRILKDKRGAIVEAADPEIFKIYERLLRNKRDRVVVPVENRCCSGCHITLTAQHENLVRKGERLVFCEHCSRIHYWQDSQAIEEVEDAPKQRRRRRSKSTTATTT
jgi:predicted  nucleic acid-binding Zn-ribbon protein